jgi:flagellar basal body-associated protein FliL
VDTSNTVSGTRGLDISFGNMFQAKYKIIMIVIIIIVVVTIAVTVPIIFLYYYCNSGPSGGFNSNFKKFQNYNK